MGDAHTGDGIERDSEKPGRQASQAPVSGGEGGSTLRAPGSKGLKKRLSPEERRAKRAEKKRLYRLYLLSPEWKRIRLRALARDHWQCQVCGNRATDVHHSRYPTKLGNEKVEWLHSLCVEHHGQIHSLTASGMVLRKATETVLGRPLKKTKFKPATPSRPKKRKNRKRRIREPRLKVRPPRKPTKLELANDELHARQQEARERRRAFTERRAIAAEVQAFYKERIA